MKKRLLRALSVILLVGCAAVSESWAQKAYSQWLFGEFVGVDFRAGSPVNFAGSVMATQEGSASIADAEGNLLFYTDGYTVYNRQHRALLNGDNLRGGWSSTQSAIIIPRPCHPGRYFIFTADVGLYKISEPRFRGIHYSEVDMTLDNGLGGIIPERKNITLYAPSTEKLTAIRHANGRDFWVITHAWASTEYRVYQVTPNGVIETPVVSYGILDPGVVREGSLGEQVIGVVRVSPDGTKLAAAHLHRGLEIMDFNPANGSVSNPRRILSYRRKPIGPENQQVVEFKTPYGLEFSGDGKWLYMTEVTQREVVQFDVNTLEGETISHVQGFLPSTIFGDLRFAPDGKIYISQVFATKLSVIAYPDRKGREAGFQYEAFPLLRISRLGLPNVPSSYLRDSLLRPEDPADLTGPTAVCQGETVTFQLSRTAERATHYRWELPEGYEAVGGKVETEQPFIVVRLSEKAGNGQVRVRSLNEPVCVESELADSIFLEVRPLPAALSQITGDSLLCRGSQRVRYTVPEIVGASGYAWELPLGMKAAEGQLTTSVPEIWVDVSATFQSGTLRAKAVNGCGFGGAAELRVQTEQLVQPTLEEQLCNLLIANKKAAPNGTWWLNGQPLAWEGEALVAESAGVYEWRILGTCDTLAAVLDFAPTSFTNLQIPSAFSPNSDARNDYFEVDERLLPCSLEIMNRWGEVVFRTDAYNNDWDGAELPTGAYFYQLQHPCIPAPLKGQIQLLR